MTDPLRAAGLRRTPARKAVHGLVEQLGRPVRHADLAAALPNLDDITLYRTLATLCEVGLLHRVLGVDGAWRYSANPPTEAGCPGNHPHFLCTVCQGMSCLRDQRMPRVDVPDGARVDGRNFLVFGACAACAAG
jgi:Fur family ferric uptake transcriptional regulator